MAHNFVYLFRCVNHRAQGNFYSNLVVKRRDRGTGRVGVIFGEGPHGPSTYLLHVTFFILMLSTLCFTPYQFHPLCFISFISSHVFSSPGYHLVPFPNQLPIQNIILSQPFHPHLKFLLFHPCKWMKIKG